MKDGQRFPVEPLLALVYKRYEPESPQHPPAPTVCFAARCLGVAPRAIYRARRIGLAEAAADRWAVRAGFHPAEVWEDWLVAGELEVSA